MKMQTCFRALAALGLALAVAAPAAASSRLLPLPGSQPEPTCLRECRGSYQTCLSAIRVELRLCRAACDDLQQKAHEVCASEPRGEACLQARAATAECLAPCRVLVNEAVAACRAGLRACNADCPDRTPVLPPDRTCLGDCRNGMQACRGDAAAAARECNSACDEIRRAAASVCQANRASVECAVAQREAHACVKPCQDRHAESLRRCQSEANDCAASCQSVDASRR